VLSVLDWAFAKRAKPAATRIEVTRMLMVGDRSVPYYEY
jgi:hypothetical protein